MARKHSNGNASSEAGKLIPVASLYDVTNIHWAKDDTMAFFSLTLHTSNGDIVLHGMKLMYNADGKPFLASASYKAENGRYYKHYYLDIAPEMASKIIEEIEDV